METIKKYRVSIAALALALIIFLVLGSENNSSQQANITESLISSSTDEALVDSNANTTDSLTDEEATEPTIVTPNPAANEASPTFTVNTTSLLNNSGPEKTVIVPTNDPGVTATFTEGATETAVNSGNTTFPLVNSQVLYRNNDHLNLTMNFEEIDQELVLNVASPFDPVALLQGISGMTDDEILERTTFTYNELRKDKAVEIGNIIDADVIVRSGHTRVMIKTNDQTFYFWIKTTNVYEAVDQVSDYLRKRTDRIWDLI